MNAWTTMIKRSIPAVHRAAQVVAIRAAWEQWLGSLRTLTCLVLLLLFSTSASAVCGMMPNYSEGATINIDMGRITVPANATIGQAFYKKEFPITGNFFAIVACAPGDATQWRVTMGAATTLANVYTTNIAGIGMRTSWVPGASAAPLYAGDSTVWRLGMPNVSGNSNSLAVNVGGTVVVELVKLTSQDKVGSGTLAGGTYTQNVAQSAYPFNTGVFLSTRIAGGGSEIVPETGTCSVSDLTVTMAPASLGQFHGVGSSSGDTAFPIVFTCSGANGAVVMTIDGDKVMSDGSLGLVKPQSGANNASCIALQIIDGDTGNPVVLGAKSQVGSVLNNATTFNLPYHVRYYQSEGGANCVAPGLVKGTATVTVSYQ